MPELRECSAKPKGPTFTICLFTIQNSSTNCFELPVLFILFFFEASVRSINQRAAGPHRTTSQLWLNTCFWSQQRTLRKIYLAILLIVRVRQMQQQHAHGMRGPAVPSFLTMQSTLRTPWTGFIYLSWHTYTTLVFWCNYCPHTSCRYWRGSPYCNPPLPTLSRR